MPQTDLVAMLFSNYHENNLKQVLHTSNDLL